MFPRLDGGYIARIHMSVGVLGEVSSLLDYDGRVELYDPQGSHFYGRGMAKHTDDALPGENFTSDASWIAFEVPNNWNEIQSSDPVVAGRWRDTTDALFEYYLGPDGRGYAICEVGVSEGKNFLLARKIEDIEGL